MKSVLFAWLRRGAKTADVSPSASTFVRRLSDRILQAGVRNPDFIEIEEIAGLFREEENVLPRGRESILDAAGHMIRLVPDDVISENPAALYHADRKPLRDEAEALSWDCLISRR